MTPEKQAILFDNTARNLGGVPEEIQIRHLRHCFKADPDYGHGIAKLLGIDVSKYQH